MFHRAYGPYGASWVDKRFLRVYWQGSEDFLGLLGVHRVERTVWALERFRFGGV